ncbi:putative squalene monooxygenase [Rosa chinensis]|uniref:Squalene monooxygenase n=1 Tax=Rosa chinensis TaxID=74649 RepID=A0A2P6RPC6_ROSCH|nr:putative squalene monooxygenase [Rosa chinensis]
MLMTMVVCTFFASMLGFLLCVLRRRDYGNAIAKEKENLKGKYHDSEECVKGSSTDVIIVGAGDGRRVHVIEKDLREPNRIVGEYLQPGEYLKLVELGLQDCIDEIDAQRVFVYALFKDGKSSKLSYPLEQFHSDVAGRGFHNGPFIQRMRAKVATLPNWSKLGTVTSLACLKKMEQLRGFNTKIRMVKHLNLMLLLTIVCDGCSSNLRRTLCKSQVEVHTCFVGLVLDNCKLPFTNHGHVIIADPSPIVFYPIRSAEFRCLVDVPCQKVPPLLMVKWPSI